MLRRAAGVSQLDRVGCRVDQTGGMSPSSVGLQCARVSRTRESFADDSTKTGDSVVAFFVTRFGATTCAV